MKIAIIGGSGYTGLELLRLLAGHPQAEVVAVTSRDQAGQKLTAAYPFLAGCPGLDAIAFEAPDPESLAGRADFIFTAVPHRTAMEVVPTLLAAGRRVVDFSADFRFRDAAAYEASYEPHQAPELLAEAVYGLPELYRSRIRSARLVGNPGCYPTSVILAMAPFLKRGLVDPARIIADSKSGVSGAGRTASIGNLFCEVDDGFAAYKVTGHRHTPEIEQEISLLAGRPVRVVFTPHLVPMTRGILSTVYAPLTERVSTAQAVAVLREFYDGERFIRVMPDGSLPHTLNVRGTNFCDLTAVVDEPTGTLKVVSVIDNLTRGASGQALCNMNIMLGLPEEMGLAAAGLRP